MKMGKSRQDCHICFADFEKSKRFCSQLDETIKVLPCKHIFHY
jgi:hypothetical protein